jgi:hypothetical protein
MCHGKNCWYKSTVKGPGLRGDASRMRSFQKPILRRRNAQAISGNDRLLLERTGNFEI